MADSLLRETERTAQETNEENTRADDPALQGDGAKDGNANDSGVDLPHWVTSQLPSDLHVEDLAGLEKPADAIRELLDARGKLSEAIIRPGDEATEEELAAYRERLGIPTDASGYDFDDLELPEDMSLEDEQLEAFRQKAFELELPPEKAKELVKWEAERQAEARDAFHKDVERKREETTKTLRKEWGDDFDANVRLMRKALATFGDEEFTEYLDESGLGNDPRMVKAFLKIGQAIVDDQLANGKPGDSQDDEEAVLRAMYPRMFARWDATGKKS